MPVRIFICEDNLMQRDYLRQAINNFILFHSEYDFELACVSEKAQTIKDYLEKEKVSEGIYFLDIDLKEQDFDGIDLAAWIRKRDLLAKIIFVTAHNELAPLTLMRRVEPMGWVDKAQGLDGIRAEVFDLLKDAYERLIQRQEENCQIFEFKIGKTNYRYHLDELQYIETTAISHKLKVSFGNRFFEFYAPMSEIEAKYPQLLRISRSCLVNTDNIIEINYSQRWVRLQSGITKSISFRYLRKVKESWDRK
ncbi:LytTR family DNA-binding domain-containing protein [Ligilactobacillus equi]|uniref:LytR/AlgR family response regulator transcription factor n=1 Tax=Ligilactobacillus equi TaxID=137357 RepID=UPI002ED11B27